MEPLSWVVIFGEPNTPRFLFERTKRSLVRRGVSATSLIVCDNVTSLTESLHRLSDSNSSVWFIQAGAWISARFGLDFPIQFPMPSASGQPLCAIGCTLDSQDIPIQNTSEEWEPLVEESFGDIGSCVDLDRKLPILRSCCLESKSLDLVLRDLSNSLGLHRSLHQFATSKVSRTILWQPIDVHFDPTMRVAQVITSLQRGGAERIAIDLHRHLNHQGYRAVLISLGAPSREPFLAPKGSIDLSKVHREHPLRLQRCTRELVRFSPDLIHAHLLKNSDIEKLSELDVPSVATIHNMKNGWPDDLRDLHDDVISLLVACSKSVERDLIDGPVPVPTRTIWNGIEMPRLAQGLESTTTLNNPPSPIDTQGEIILAAVANPRPQKRLERLPAIAAALQSRLLQRGRTNRVRLRIAGQASAYNAAAIESAKYLEEAIVQSGMSDQIEMLGPVEDISNFMTNIDVVVSPSAYEGLSLAHLEALANNRPVVATDVGGTREIASRCSGLRLVAADASANEFADKIMEVIGSPQRPTPSSYRDAIERDFSAHAMTIAYAQMYQRVVSTRTRPPGEGLMLIINNFSTGGAQSSARRLLMGLHERGIKVQAVVLEEQFEYPTEGRRALVAAGIPVTALRCSGTIDPLSAIQPLLHQIDRSPPKKIVFWNAIAEYKILLADMIWGIDLFDVSPGEMYYSSLDRYFQRPRPGLPCIDAKDFGARLKGMVVKYEGERAEAVSRMGTAVHVVPNGVQLKRRVDHSVSKAHVMIGTVARISHQKKLEELIEATRLALPNLPPVRVQIVGGVERGSESYAEQLRQSSQGLPIDWLGEHSTPDALLQSWDMFVLISEPAGCPNAGLEAMAYGLPMLATDVGGASEQVIDGHNGRLVPRGNVNELATAMVELSKSQCLRAKFGEASFDRAAKHFCVKRMIDDYLRIFDC